MNQAKWLWSSCILFLPLVMVYGLIDVVTIPRLTLLLLSSFVVTGLFIFNSKQTFVRHIHSFSTSYLGISLWVYFILGGISLFQALSLSDGIVEWFKIWSWINIILISSFLLKEQDTAIITAKVVSISALIVSLIGLGEFVSILGRLDENKILYTVNSTFEHKNLLATGLLLSFPFTIKVYRHAAGIWWKGIAVITVFSALGLVLFIQSRAAWIGLAGAISIYIFISFLIPDLRSRLFSKRIMSVLGVVLLLGVGAVFFWGAKSEVINAPVKRIQAVFTYEDTKNEHTETINERFHLWRNTYKMIKQNPISGVGLGNWKIHFPKYSVEGLRSEQGQIFFQRPHNDYLWVASETGVLGGLAYLAVFGSLFLLAFNVLKYRGKKETANHEEIVLISSALFAFLLFSFFDFPKERLVHLLWSGILIAYLWNASIKLNADSDKVRKGGNNILIYAFPFLSLLGVVFMSIRWQSEFHCKNALEARTMKNYTLSLAELEIADNWTYQLDPASTPLAWYRGEALYLQRQIPAAMEAFQASHALNPYHVHTLNNLGASYYAMNNIKEAKNYFEQVLKFAPHFPDANLNLGAMAFNAEKTREAAFYIGNCIPNDYQDGRFLQFLTTISQAYAQKLGEIVDLSKITPIIQDFAKNQEWQVRMHQQAHQYNRTFAEQIHLDLLYVAMDTKVINVAEEDSITKALNNFLIKHVQK